MIGEILQFAGGSVPDGYLLCDGTAVGRAEYPELFDIIGTTYGPGDGSSTFNLPDFSGRVALGSSQSYQFGSTGGSSEATLSSSDIPSHSHVVPAHSHEDDIGAETPTLTHNVTSQCSFTYTRLNGTTSERSSTAVNYYSSRTSGAMTRSTDFAVADHPATACTMSGGVLDCAAFDTENSGAGHAHNNMMPYLAVTYLIHAYIPVPVEPGMALYNGCCVVSAGGGYITGKT
jgi:microcystin-dependent protein